MAALKTTFERELNFHRRQAAMAEETIAALKKVVEMQEEVLQKTYKCIQRMQGMPLWYSFEFSFFFISLQNRPRMFGNLYRV
jgi:hypothetical protein